MGMDERTSRQGRRTGGGNNAVKSPEQVLPRLVRKLAADYPLDSIRAALIRHWAATNDTPLSVLTAGRVVGELLDAPDPDSVLKQFERSVGRLSIKGVESAFESLIDEDQRRSRGAVYTPGFIVAYLIENGLLFGWHDRAKVPHICDPACGSGGFLIGAALTLLKDHGLSLDRALSESLIGFDIDAAALRHTQCLLELLQVSLGASLPGPQLRIHRRDTLLSKPEDLWEASGCFSGFNVVATNPPYVKLQSLDVAYRNRLLERYSNFAKGSFSSALLFLLAGHRLLTPGGCLALITQNNLYTSLAGKDVRRYIQERRCIRRIVDFGHHKVFRNASAYTCLIFLGTEGSERFEYGSLTSGVDGDRLSQTTFSSISHNELNPRKWRLAHKKHLINLHAIESVGRPLGVVTSIKVGFATLKDSVFFVRGDNRRCVASLPSGASVEVEAGLTRPAVKIAELQDETDLARNDRRIIFPYEKAGTKYHLIPEVRLRSEYPKAHSYLLKCRALLLARDKGLRDYENWYAWGRTQGMEAPGPKLLTKTFSARPQFLLDTSDQLFCNGYAIFPSRQLLLGEYMPIEALARILNSRVMHYYAKLTSFQIEGDYQCYQKNFIELFGVASMSPGQVDELLSLPDGAVDQYVADLYGLSLEEINEVVGVPAKGSKRRGRLRSGTR